MKLAALYWFYRSPRLAAHHLRVARAHNPEVPFYGLYGGPTDSAGEFTAALGPALDDYHAYSRDRHPQWKWRHGDQLIVDWYLHRGHRLEWDAVAIVQWDTLVLGPLHAAFAGPQPALVVTGLVPVREVESTWWWVRPDAPANRAVFRRFHEHLRERHGYRDEPLCCLFVTACLPRAFLDAYAGLERPGLGFLEYKLPMYAQAFGIPVRAMTGPAPYRATDRNAGPVDEYPMNGMGVEIPAGTIARHLARADGARLFHPVRRPVVSSPP